MADAFIGEIRTFAGKIPRGWVECKGQLLGIQQNQALFSSLGTAFGGNGVNTFGLPDLQGRVPIGAGQGSGFSGHSRGEIGGQESYALTVAQLPSHDHSAQVIPSNERLKNNTPGPNRMLSSISGENSSGTAYNLQMYSDSQFPLTAMHPHTVDNGPAQPHENRMPSLVLTYCISLTGVFPSRS